MPIPNDPLRAQQWHLKNPIPGLLDLNVLGVWNPAQGAAYTGLGTVTLLIGDGFDYTHSDFNLNYRSDLDYDFVEGDLDPSGLASDSQGTAAMGVIGAEADGTGTVGIAYQTQMVGYRVASVVSDAWLVQVRDAIAFSATNARADVTMVGQSLSSDANSGFGIGYDLARFSEIKTSIGTAVNTGRDALGTTIVKAAGDARGDSYDINADGASNDTRQVVVAAVEQNGAVASYSSHGAAVLISGLGGLGVVTTDRVGAAGNSLTSYSAGYEGTAAAAAMVTGVVQLMYDANAGLGWRDVQSILAASGRHVGSAVGSGIAGDEKFAWNFNASSTWNGGGMHFSNDYGHGLVDALAAVRLAESWLLTGALTAQQTSNEFSNSVDVLNVATLIPSNVPQNFSGTAAFDDLVERVTVTVAFSTTYLGDVEIWLISPDGTESPLIADQAGSADFNGTWTFESQAFRGERAAGTWTVRINDDQSGDDLTVTDAVVRIYGTAANSDRYVYTNEYSDYAGLFGHVTTVVDSNGGTDDVNASAVTSASVIRLDGVAGRIDGVVTSFTNMENAIGGDAGDLLVGSLGNNVLLGMRGNDTLRGGQGADTLDGGTGFDTADYSDQSASVRVALRGANAVDVSINGVVQDSIRSIEHINGGTGADALTGDAQNNRLSGAFGLDTLNGGLGTDVLIGGLGNDRFVFSTALGANNIDTITDFQVGFDKIALDDDIFTALGIVGTAAGVALTASRFQLGAAANSIGDRIVYNQTTGQLFYDADGNGAGAQQQIALIGVSTHAALTAASFIVVA